MTSVVTKRVYDPPETADGLRMLADRLWPRGLAKATAQVELWAKEITPSTALRQSYHAGEIGWAEFAERYRAEIATNPSWPEVVAQLRPAPVVTLLSAVRDIDQSHLPILADALRRSLASLG